MLRLRPMAVSLVVAVASALVPTAAGATGGSGESHSRTSEVDFGACTELATGTTVALSELRARVPDSVPVLSLTDQGIAFPGSDELGILIIRTLECDSITVNRNGRTRTQRDRHIAHVGTPVDASVLPATPFSNDGGNGADFNNYIFAYYSDSSTYRSAMRRAGVRHVASARIDIRDETGGRVRARPERDRAAPHRAGATTGSPPPAPSRTQPASHRSCRSSPTGGASTAVRPRCCPTRFPASRPSSSIQPRRSSRSTPATARSSPTCSGPTPQPLTPSA